MDVLHLNQNQYMNASHAAHTAQGRTSLSPHRRFFNRRAMLPGKHGATLSQVANRYPQCRTFVKDRQSTLLRKQLVVMFLSQNPALGRLTV